MPSDTTSSFRLRCSSALRKASVLFSSTENQINTNELVFDYSTADAGMDQLSNVRWIHTLSNKEYLSLIAVVLVMPAIAVGFYMRNKTARRLRIIAILEDISTRDFLREMTTFNPIHVRAFHPGRYLNTIQDEHSAKPVKFPPYLTPAKMTGLVTGIPWRNPDPSQVVAAMKRFNRLTKEEIKEFATAYRYFHSAHAAAFSVDRTIRWILTGQTNATDIRAGLVPRSAATDLTAPEQELIAQDKWHSYAMYDNKAILPVRDDLHQVNLEAERSEPEEIAREQAAITAAAAARVAAAEAAETAAAAAAAARALEERTAMAAEHNRAAKLKNSAKQPAHKNVRSDKLA